jgi:hypothetical protein
MPRNALDCGPSRCVGAKVAAFDEAFEESFEENRLGAYPVAV